MPTFQRLVEGASIGVS